MTRRKFIATSAALGTVTAKAQARTLRVNVRTMPPLGAIPRDFMGLGYEISSVAEGPLSVEHRSDLQLVRTLSRRGVIRIGGNTSDYSSFAANGKTVSAPKATVINEASLRALGQFLDATGWQLIWGLNLGGGTEQNAVAEAQAVAHATKGHLLAFEIGNEPDLFGHGTAHRPKSYSYDEYLREYRTYKSAIRRVLPEAPFAGPDAAAATDWVTRFAADEGKDLRLLTHHYYRECASKTSTLERLLAPDPKLQPELEKLKAASASCGVPYRICETNSLCGGGKPGVSDTFGAALWALDFMWKLAWADAAGVNMETGVNQLGWISWYSPLGDDQHGGYSAKPDYYGMLAFAQGSLGQRFATECDAGGLNLTAYASGDEKRVAVTLVNKEARDAADASIVFDRALRAGRVMRLTGPSLESKQGIHWNVAPAGTVSKLGQSWKIHLPAASAAVITFA